MPIYPLERLHKKTQSYVILNCLFLFKKRTTEIELCFRAEGLHVSAFSSCKPNE